MVRINVLGDMSEIEKGSQSLDLELPLLWVDFAGNEYTALITLLLIPLPPFLDYTLC
jgi:hypothetical protein